MPINSDKPDRWPADIAASVDQYNDWFVRYAPQAYRRVRGNAQAEVLIAMEITRDFRAFGSETLRANPGILRVLRMAALPPLAVDRVVGLAGVPKTLVAAMERDGLPARMSEQSLRGGIDVLVETLSRMLDPDLFPWLHAAAEPSEPDRLRAASIIADRLTGASANPIIRNAQEQRQLDLIGEWLRQRGYREQAHGTDRPLADMEPGTYAYRMIVKAGDQGQVNIPVDVVVQPHSTRPTGLPVLIEAKSAGDFTNVNKRRKEEAAKMYQLRDRYGPVEFVLFLGGYFDLGYLRYEARAGIDWVWEHRIDDLSELGF